MIDSGADLIIGTHPHVIQIKEKYNGKWIYYSIGNFVFDQYWNAKVSCGLLLSVQISSERIQSISETTAKMDKGGTTFLAGCDE